MSLIGEFLVPSEEVALHDTLRAVPGLVVEIERVVATHELFTPYFWIADSHVEAFEEAAEHDPSVDNLHRLDEFEEATLYRADWTERTESLIYAYTTIGATILDAKGQDAIWQLRMQFDERAHLDEFNEYCRENGSSYTVSRLHEMTDAKAPSQYGLTEKQEEALVTAWEMGYFDMPREVTLSGIATELGISEQALANRLRRGYDALVGNALRVDSIPARGSDTDHRTVG